MSDKERVQANEPNPVSDQERSDAPTTPAQDAAAESAIDEDSAGDGVAFFEGGDGREEARDDIERSG